MTIVRKSIAELRAATNALTDAERVRLDAMTETEIEASALSDPDNPPWTDEELAEARKARSLRKLSITLEDSKHQGARIKKPKGIVT